MEKTLVKKWFMIHTYSGYEKKVKTDLEQKIETLGMGDIVTKILVPEEETIEEVRGKKKTVARKIFPGYVMLEMVATREESNEGINFRVDSDAWYVVRNTNGVTGFVGVGSDPIPMEDEEVKNIFEVIGLDLTEEEKELKEVIKINFAVGDYVKVLKGGFADQEGKVAEIDMEHKKAKVMIEMFGRMTPVEVDFDSVQKAN
ncbi:MAG: transcription termination/antitermination protein NusG [Fusobacterium mortiferum]|uniref:Transcription termination/antitermination protein NusG n=2 Tax=Fusobacterium mortiferum TaxID=850 RepID=A0A414PRN1_FUSMR|nr:MULTISPECIES: transcription termination/antitermination protein NusG [Fusobacterium]AVQ17928.1 transcription termination/antitermination factor NusG [Fusobacterium mortiferum ATCC 9817]EEO36887.1 transcription termination/antitermination factor NusG [Fusobacterium mortiferum ATCC 9817]MCF2628211.1 transcription termination/antitermination factor NusG [Fusobacterium mortiferum]MCF2700035.1 transcription termination/antitermination factor NusG [Fusobacterium mortiferum]MCI6383005.1 transcript